MKPLTLRANLRVGQAEVWKYCFSDLDLVRGALQFIRAVALIAVAVFGSGSPPLKAASLDPIITVNINGSRNATAYRGMPLLIRVAVLHPEAFDTNAAPLVLGLDSGSWTNGIQFKLSSTTGAKPMWPLTAIVPGSNSVTLDSQHYAELVWWVAPAFTATLSTGQCQITVSLNTTNATATNVWKGVIESTRASLTLSDEPVTLTMGEKLDKAVWFAQYELFNGQSGAALNRINTFVAAYPTNTTGLTVKAFVLEHLGRIHEALATSQQALTLFQTFYPNSIEPPLPLMRLQAGLEKKLFQPKVTVATYSQGLLSLSWQSFYAGVYDVETSTNLQTWRSTAAGIVAQGTSSQWTNAAVLPKEFFRIRLR